MAWPTPSIKWTDGAADGNLNTVGNWNTGAAPVSTDDVAIDTGSRDITAGALTCKSLTVTEGFRYNFGTTSGGSLAVTLDNIDNTNRDFDITVAGAFFKMSVVTSTVSRARVTFASSGTFAITSGTLLELRTVGGGRVDIDASAVVTTLLNNGATVTAASGTAFTTAIVASGNLSTDRASTTLIVGGGARVQMNGTSTITTGYILGGGTLNDRSSGTFATIYVSPGATYTPAGTTKATKQITTLYTANGANVIRSYGGFLLTTTTNINTRTGEVFW